ncbi:MAG TPA: serpin family protein [Candidatus Limnocylindrales bacterium]|nr:serpin family protein [Candidatus Limnocylindrales bacterium]
MRSTTVEAINQFSARWAAIPPAGEPTVFSAACAWPLLGLLAAAASGSVRDDLQGALGVPSEAAHDLAADVLTSLSDLPGVAAALGLWSRRDLPLRPQWTESLPPGVVDLLSGDPEVDRERLDAWASEHTAGLIPAMPVQVKPSTVLVLATALALRTRWVHRFTDVPLTASGGPWAPLGTLAGLRRGTGNLDDVTVLDTSAGAITRLRLEGDNSLDVHLVLGSPDVSVPEVLAAGISRPDGITGSQLPLGANAPGLTVEETTGPATDPELAVMTVLFTVRAEHDLLSSPAFGLQKAAEAGDHFPGISPDPLCVSEARQSAMAIFSAEGFEAAAITAVAMTRAHYVEPDKTRKTIRVTFDRPFGFYATHRASGLVLAGGWVTDPSRWPG